MNSSGLFLVWILGQPDVAIIAIILYYKHKYITSSCLYQIFRCIVTISHTRKGVNTLDDKRQEFTQLLDISPEEFLSALRRRGSVLFLGQKYQQICYGKEYFIEAVQEKFVNNTATSLDNFSDLWQLITNPVISVDKDIIPRTMLTNSQKEQWNSDLINSAVEAQSHDTQKAVAAALHKNPDGPIPSDPLIRTNRMLSAGWNLVVTSSPESMLCRTLGSPFSAENTIITSESPIPQKFSARSLSLLQLFDPSSQHGLHLQTAYDEFGVTNDDSKVARKALNTALNRILQYNGYLIIDAWNPDTDWFTLEDMKELMNGAAGQNQVQVLFFGLSPDVARRIKKICRNNSFIFFDEDTHIVDLFSDNEIPNHEEDEEYYIQFENEPILTMTLLPDGSGRGNANPLSIDIPMSAWNKLSFAKCACIVPSAMQAEELSIEAVSTQQRLVSFFAQIRGIPLWDSLRSCSFERAIFTDFRDGVQKVLRSSKHRNEDKNSPESIVPRDPLILLKGSACSGKTILLGQVAMDMAVYYPTIYFEEQAIPYQNTEQFESFVDELSEFIQTYLASNMKHFNRRRVLIIWDGDLFESEARRIYRSLSDKLMSRSVEFTLIGSAYSSSISQKLWSNEYRIEGELQEVEETRLRELLTKSLDLNHQDLERIFKFNNTNTLNLFGILNALFRDTDDRIMYLLSEGIYKESAAAKEALSSAFENLENARKYGAISAAIGNYEFTNEENSSELLETAQNCASLLDDILAVASSGLKPQPLHYVLVFDMLQEMYAIHYGETLKRLGFLQDFLDMLLYYSPLIQSSGSVYQDEWTLCYRSPLEAKAFLREKYESIRDYKLEYLQKENLTWMDVKYVTNRTEDSYPIGPRHGKCFLEFRQMEVLHYALQCGLRDTDGIFSYDVLPLADVLGPNADREVCHEGESHVSWYPYIAHALLLYGEDNIAACQKAAFWLRRYDTSEITWHPETVLDENVFNKIDQTESILTNIISAMSSLPYYEGASLNQKIQLYTEWAANRRCVYCPQADFDNELRQTRAQYGQPLLETVECRIEEDILPLLERTYGHSANHIVDIYIGMLHKAVSVYYTENQKKPLTFEQKDALSHHMDFFWRVILFKLTDSDFLEYDLREGNRNPTSTAKKISEIFKKWAELAQNTDWMEQAQQRMTQQDRQLFQEHRPTWWVNRISHLWHSNIKMNTDDWSRALSDNLYYSSLQYHISGTKLSPEQLAQAQYIVDVIEGTELLGDCPDRGCKDLLANTPQLTEYYVRAKWMAETKLFPYTEEARPKLKKDVWKSLFDCCEDYCNYPHTVKADYFLYYLHAIHSWLLSTDCTVRSEAFQYCSKHKTANYIPLRLPIGGYGLTNENFLYLCWEDGTPVEVTCIVVQDAKGHRRATIQQKITSSECVGQMDYKKLVGCLRNKELYVADTLLPKTGNTARYYIRFNDLGPLAGPLSEGGEIK